MTHHTDAQLLPCPFCGGDAYIVDDLITFNAECEICGSTGSLSSYRIGAAEAWNRRAQATRGNSQATVKQQLTVEAAPVQLPELAGWIDDGGMVFWNDGRKPNDGEIIYTEQQVRELLAAHGIEEPQ